MQRNNLDFSDSCNLVRLAQMKYIYIAESCFRDIVRGRLNSVITIAVYFLIEIRFRQISGPSFENELVLSTFDQLLIGT